MVAKPCCAKEMELVLGPCACPRRSELGHMWGACTGAHWGVYHSAVFHNCCLPADKSLLCPCTQGRAFQIASAVNLISVEGLLISFPTQNEQPDSRRLIRSRARSGACQLPGLCKQPLPELGQSTSIHCREDCVMPQTDIWDKTALTYLDYLSERDGKWAIRKRGGVGSILSTLVVKKWAWKLLGGPGEATVTGPVSPKGTRLVSPQTSKHVWNGPRELLSASHCTAGARELLCLPKWVKSINREAQPSAVYQEKDWKEYGLGQGLFP